MADRVVASNPTNLDLLDPPRRNQLVPVDTYVAPPPAAANTYNQLGSALANLNPEINRFLLQQGEQANEQAVKDATAQHLASAKSWRDATAAGDISADQNPWFIKTWKELDGQNQADAAAATIQQNYATDPISQSADPKAVQQWIQQQTSAAISGITDPDELAGATKKLTALQSTMMAAHAEQAEKNAITGMTDSLGTQIGNIIDQAKASGRPINAAALADVLHGPTGMAKFGSLNPKLADQVYLQAVIDKAKQYKDPGLLDILSQSKQDVNDPSKVVPGVGTTAEGLAHVVAARQEIKSQITQDKNQAYDLQEHQRTLAAQTMQKQIFTRLAAGQPVSDQDILRYGALDAGGAEKILGVQSALQKRDQQMDPKAFAQQLSSILAPDPNGTRSSSDRMLAAISSGAITVPSSEVPTLLSKAQEMDDSGIQKMKPVQDVVEAIRHDGADPNPSVAPIFKDPDSKLAVTGLFMDKALAIVKAYPGVAPEALNQQFLQAYDQAKDEYAKLYPGKLSLGDKGPSHASSLDMQQPQQPAKQTQAQPEELPNLAQPSPFTAPSQNEIQAIKKSAADPRAKQDFIQKYGRRAYENAIKG